MPYDANRLRHRYQLLFTNASQMRNRQQSGFTDIKERDFRKAGNVIIKIIWGIVALKHSILILNLVNVFQLDLLSIHMINKSIIIETISSKAWNKNLM